MRAIQTSMSFVDARTRCLFCDGTCWRLVADAHGNRRVRRCECWQLNRGSAGSGERGSKAPSRKPRSAAGRPTGSERSLASFDHKAAAAGDR